MKYESVKLKSVLWAQKIIRYSFYALFFFVPIFFLPQTSELFEFNKLIATYTIATLIIGSWAIRCMSEKRLIFKRTPLDIPLIIFLGVQGISLLFSIDPHTSFFGYYGRWNGGVLSLITYASLYWAYVSNMDKKATINTLASIIASTAYISVYAILEHFGFSLSCLTITQEFGVKCWVQDVQTRVFATLGQPNWLAAMVAAIIFIPFTKAITAKTYSTSQWLNSFFAVLILLALVFTKSRSGLLGFGIALIVYLGLVMTQFSAKFIRTLIPKFAVSFVIIITSVFLFPNPVRDLVLNKVSTAIITPTKAPVATTSLESGGTESGEIRKIVWTGAVRIWQASTKHVLIGTGPETFAMAYYAFRPIEHNATSEWELLYNKAHNEFLNYLSTTGALGLLTYLGVLGFMAYQFIQLLDTKQISSEATDKMLLIGIVAGWLTIPITNFWGFSVVVVQLLLFLLPAIATTLTSTNNEPKAQPLSLVQKSLIATIFMVMALVLFQIGKYWLADYYYAKAQKSEAGFSSTQNAEYIIQGFDQINKAFDLNPSEPSINTQLSSLAGYMALLTTDLDATSSASLLQLSDAASKRAVQLSPQHPSLYKSRARTLILLSALDEKYLQEADETLKQAQLLSPTDPRLPFNRGIIAKYQQHYPQAIDYFTQSLKLKPDFDEPRVQLEEIASQSATQSESNRKLVK